MFVDGAGLEARENIEREAQEAHGAEGHVVDDLIGLLVRHLPSMQPVWRRFFLVSYRVVSVAGGG